MEFDIPAPMEVYLKSNDVVDADNDVVRLCAERVMQGATNDVGAAQLAFEWVRDTIPHTRDAGREEVTCSASEVIAAGTGICYAKSHLLAALLRSRRIPSGFCYQLFENEDAPGGEWALHGLNGVYLGSISRWIRLDSRGNTNGIDASFDVDCECA